MGGGRGYVSDGLRLLPIKSSSPNFSTRIRIRRIPSYQTQLGVYEKGCGLDKVDLSWGHDEYFYHIAKPYLPEPALYMIRYHSFYPAHREGAYDYLMNDHDRKMFEWVRKFNPYDLYSKSDHKPSVKELKPYYQGLIEKYFPSQVEF